MIAIRAEEGSAVVEFISLMFLLLLPIVTYFSLHTVESTEQFREDRILREVVEIIRAGGDFQESVNLAERFLSLQGSSSRLLISCLSGACPHRESIMKIELRNSGGSMERVVRGGKWQ